ncbi:GTPase [Irpex rosettiformis]|uniref:GTPase n=1 Tax=Irpex rosettiformis TaxID=378272 RepID=A0ACB8U242_9APHY|nr:GTPase [Irpex rosettiformis]
MLHALNLRTFLRPINVPLLTHLSRRCFAAESYGLLPKHVVEKARQSLPPSAVQVTPTQASPPEGSLSEEGGNWTSRSLSGLDEDERAAAKRKRRTEWKRRQGKENFLDHVIIHVRGGKGGDGCVAFHREKFKPYGPPSGGSGGSGGDVYILPTPHLTTLSSVPVRVRAQAGGHGQGTWQNGKTGAPTIIKVPLGTIVRQLAQNDPRRAKDEFEAEEEGMEGLEVEEKRKKLRAMRWVHYPDWEDENVERDTFQEAERTMYREERERRLARKMRASHLIHLDLDKVEETVEAKDPNAPLGTGRKESFGHLVARGGVGGYGNPHFLGPDNRSPKFATRGTEGERISLSLELKLLADIGLVGMPNAGKSTLLRAITGGRARTEVAGYAFTTLNPIVGVVRVRDDGSFEGWDEGRVVDETRAEELKEREMLDAGEFADALTRNQKAPRENWGYEQSDATFEDFRFTVADNPGLISQASDNVGLGHSFLRSIERSPALVYVVDLSEPAPWDELVVLRDELEKYQPGMSLKARLVVANKADLLGGGQEGMGGDEEAVMEAREKLARLQEFVKNEFTVPQRDMLPGRELDVVPISAKFSMNLRKVATLMRGYVEDAREVE